MKTKITNAKIIDTYGMIITNGDILINGSKIEKIGKINEKVDETINANGRYIVPGFIDAHTHIESSLLTPTEFSRIVIKHGTTTVIADPHEICNVIGINGLELFLKESKSLPLEIFFVVPSCVPASKLGTAGAEIGLKDIQKAMKNKRVVGLGEVMDFPAVLQRKKGIMAKIKAADKKIVNGHAPGLYGKDMRWYFDAGPSDDHESLTYAEMIEKADYGVMLFLREGSAEVSQSEQYKIINSHPGQICFCSDDKNVDDIERYGSILFNVNKAISLGYDPLLAIRCATYNCAMYYGIDEIGDIKCGFRANFFLTSSLKKIKPEIVFANGKIIFSNKNGIKKIPKFKYPQTVMNTIKHDPIKESEILLPKATAGNIIEATDGNIHTEWKKTNKLSEYDIKKDILKIVVIERYKKKGNISVGQITGFGIKNGAIGSTVAHDCHNIIALGTSDDAIIKVVNHLIRIGGGFAVYNKKTGLDSLDLPIAGLMSQNDHIVVAMKLRKLREKAHKLGCKMKRPFSTLSFMALEVIPELKISDKGLVDVNNFKIL